MSAHVFCRDLCLARGEPLAGTGKLAQRTLLLRWPRGKWRVPRFESADMSPTLSEAVRLAMQAGIHVALVDRTGEFDALPHLQAEGIAADYDSEAALAEAITRFTAGTPLSGRPDTRTTILCCTDSRRDACCARYGFATFKALRAAADPEKINLLQATHVGGCRFAASLVVLPQRQRYGRLSPDEAPAFLAALERGEIYISAYRGRPDLPEAIQAAEVAALAWAEKRGIAQADVHIHAQPTIPPQEGAELSLAAHAGPTRLHLRLRTEILPVNGRCDALNEGIEPEMTPRWSVAAISEATNHREIST